MEAIKSRIFFSTENRLFMGGAMHPAILDNQGKLLFNPLIDARLDNLAALQLGNFA